MFSMVISDIIERFTEADTVIMGDVSICSVFERTIHRFCYIPKHRKLFSNKH